MGFRFHRFSGLCVLVYLDIGRILSDEMFRFGLKAYLLLNNPDTKRHATLITKKGLLDNINVSLLRGQIPVTERAAFVLCEKSAVRLKRVS